MAEEGRYDYDNPLLILPCSIRARFDLLPGRHSVHLPLLVEVGGSFDPVKVDVGDDPVRHVGQSPGGANSHPIDDSGHEGDVRYSRHGSELEGRDGPKVRDQEEGGSGIEPIGVPISGKLEGEQIGHVPAGRIDWASLTIQPRVRAGYVLRVEAGAVVHRGRAGGYPSCRRQPRIATGAPGRNAASVNVMIVDLRMP